MERIDLKRVQVFEALESLVQDGGQLLCGQLMTREPTCVSPDMTAVELIKLFHQKRFRHLLVADQGRLVGVISDRDVIRCLGPERAPDRSNLEGITAARLMSIDVVTVRPGTTVERAVTLMIDEGISCLPVLSDGQLVGIVTNTDLHIALQLLLQRARQATESQSEPAVAASSSRHN